MVQVFRQEARTPCPDHGSGWVQIRGYSPTGRELWKSHATDAVTAASRYNPSQPAQAWAADLDAATWRDEFGIAGEQQETVDNVAVVDLGGENVLQITVPGIPDRSVRYGHSIVSSFDLLGVGPQEEAFFGYDVYVPADFEWTDVGGKLPGLAGITEGAATWSAPTGGNYNENGFTGRLMWRAGGALVGYLYVKHANGQNIATYGIDVPAGSLTAGAWNDIVVRYRMNTVGFQDGLFQLWVDGALEADIADVEYRTSTSPDLTINQAYITCFFGGAVEAGPVSTERVSFRNFWVGVPT